MRGVETADYGLLPFQELKEANPTISVYRDLIALGFLNRHVLDEVHGDEIGWY